MTIIYALSKKENSKGSEPRYTQSVHLMTTVSSFKKKINSDWADLDLGNEKNMNMGMSGTKCEWKHVDDKVYQGFMLEKPWIFWLGWNAV